ncbi:TetR/AcrR family transcriptional regulator [Thermovibrio sp.]
MMVSNKKPVRVSKKVILEAAEKVFSEYGFHEAKIYKIAEFAGVSVGTIYRFFKSKEELYSEVLRKKLLELKSRVESSVKHKTPERALKAYISTVIDFFEEKKEFFTIFMREVGSLSVIDEERFNLTQWYREYVKELSKIVERGVKRKVFKDLDPILVILAISGAMKNTVYAQIQGLVKKEPEELKETLYELFLNGLLKK